MICGLVVGKIYKYEFRLYLQNLSGICKNGHNFCILTRMKKKLYEKSSTRKVTSKFNWGNPVKHFQNPQKPNRKKVRGLSRSRGKKIQKISNLLVAHHLLGAPLVTEKKLVSIFFGTFSKNDT